MKESKGAPTAASTDEKPEDQLVKTKSPEVVRGMFAAISPTYDLLNHAFSLNIDKQWRKRLAGTTIKQSQPRQILDVCGGTGDLALALRQEALRQGLNPNIICSDFTPQMMELARKKFVPFNQAAPMPLVADTTRLPFHNDHFDLVTVAFGIRNVVDPLVGLQEMARVCRPGGTVAVLEFSRTRNVLIDGGFDLYFSHILPAIGKLVTGTRAYSYLSKSVDQFPEGAAFCSLMSTATGSETVARRLSFGIATLYTSIKAKP